MSFHGLGDEPGIFLNVSFVLPCSTTELQRLPYRKGSFTPAKFRVRVKQHIRFPLRSAFRSGHLACYQQAGVGGSGSGNGKYVGVSGKRIR